MANNEDTTKITLDLDNKEFVKKMKESLGLMGDLGSVDSLKELSGMFLKIGMVAGVAAAAVLAVKTSIDFVEEGEKIKQVNAAFENMAESAGLAANVIKDQLIKSAGGLADSTDILMAANKAFVSMGDNAGKLPQIMDVARRATALFGGDLISNFEKLNLAMSTGNARALRQFGIIVDTEKATKEYAKTLGIGTDFLSEAGKKQAIFNEALSQSQDKFKNVDLNITETSNNIKKIQVALGDIKEAAAIAWEALAGPTVRRVTGQIADVVHGLAVNMKAAFGHGEERAAAQKEALEREIAQYKIILEQTNKLFNGPQYEMTEKHLRSKEQQLQKINEQEERSLQLKQKQEGAAGPVAKTSAGGPSQEDLDKIKEAKSKFEKDLLQLRKDRQAAEEQIETDVANLTVLHIAEESRINEEAELKKAEIKKLYDADSKTKGIISQQQYAEAVEEIERKKVADLAVINNKYYDDQVNALKNLEKQNQYTAAGFTTAWKRNFAQNKSDMSNMSKLGDMTFKSFKSRAVEAFKAMGDGSKTGAEAVKGFILGALGDIAIEWGTFHLINGVATYNPVEVAQGGALIALGAALHAMSSTGSGSTAGSASEGGGGASGPGFDAPGSGAAQPQVAANKKSVTVAIHGNYFETEQTRTRLMEMIREAGDFTDFNLKQIGQP